MASSSRPFTSGSHAVKRSPDPPGRPAVATASRHRRSASSGSTGRAEVRRTFKAIWQYSKHCKSYFHTGSFAKSHPDKLVFYYTEFQDCLSYWQARSVLSQRMRSPSFWSPAVLQDHTTFTQLACPTSCHVNGSIGWLSSLLHAWDLFITQCKAPAWRT